MDVGQLGGSPRPAPPRPDLPSPALELACTHLACAVDPRLRQASNSASSASLSTRASSSNEAQHPERPADPHQRHLLQAPAATSNGSSSNSSTQQALVAALQNIQTAFILPGQSPSPAPAPAAEAAGAMGGAPVAPISAAPALPTYNVSGAGNCTDPSLLETTMSTFCKVRCCSCYGGRRGGVVLERGLPLPLQRDPREMPRG